MGCSVSTTTEKKNAIQTMKRLAQKHSMKVQALIVAMNDITSQNPTVSLELLQASFRKRLKIGSQIAKTFKRICGNIGGSVLVEEYISATILLTLGTPGERCHAYFAMFDKDDKGWLTKDELFEMMDEILFHSFSTYSERKEYQSMIFQEMDKEGTGKIGRKMFVQTCLNHQIVCDALMNFCKPVYKEKLRKSPRKSARVERYLNRRNAMDAGHPKYPRRSIKTAHTPYRRKKVVSSRSV